MFLGSNDVDSFKLGGSQVDKVMLGSELVWIDKVPAGSQTFDYTDGLPVNFTIPQGYNEVNIQMSGGGGQGAGGIYFGTGGQGGKVGTQINGVYPVDYGATYAITIGVGGSDGDINVGGSGDPSSFGSIVTATGGAGGSERVGIEGSAGENSQFGLGGQQGQQGQAGGTSAGGGGSDWSWSNFGGVGGNGRCIVSWGD